MLIATPFAAVEDMLAQSQRMLFNAVATICLPADVAGLQIGGIFDAAYLFVDQASGFESAAPAITVLDCDMPPAMADALEQGDGVALEIRRCTYSVVESKPDSAGVSVLRLRK